MKLDIQKNPNEILEAIVKYHGIDTIRSFIKKHNKKERKKQIRVNTYIDIAYKVYKLMSIEKYSKTKAIDKVSKDSNITVYTVRNHCTKFDKKLKNTFYKSVREIKAFDYIAFGKQVNHDYAYNNNNGDYSLDDIISVLSNSYDLDKKFCATCYYKYTVTNTVANIDTDFNIPF